METILKAHSILYHQSLCMFQVSIQITCSGVPVMHHRYFARNDKTASVTIDFMLRILLDSSITCLY